MKALIFAIAFFAVSAVVGAVVVGNLMVEDILDEDPYEAGLKWDQSQRNLLESGIKIQVLNSSFKKGENNIQIRLSGEMNKLEATEVTGISITRPTTDQFNTDLKLTRHDSGILEAVYRFPQHGYWNLLVQAKTGTKNLQFAERIFVEK